MDKLTQVRVQSFDKAAKRLSVLQSSGRRWEVGSCCYPKKIFSSIGQSFPPHVIIPLLNDIHNFIGTIKCGWICLNLFSCKIISLLGGAMGELQIPQYLPSGARFYQSPCPSTSETHAISPAFNQAQTLHQRFPSPSPFEGFCMFFISVRRYIRLFHRL